ncbi:MAG: hypothetical protein UCH28_03350 [Adlercreutzia sp.]|nr:hypothetical protein [Adlercreutzia sp.]
MVFDAAFSCFVLVVYAANRFLRIFAIVLPEGFVLYHFGDLCGGALFAAYANLICVFAGASFRFDTLPKIMGLELICSVAWEFFAPMIWKWSTADILDVLCYFFGGMLYWTAREFSRQVLAIEGKKPHG